MIDRSHRFHGYNALNFLYRRAQVIRSERLTLKYTTTRPGKTYRAAVVVSKKVSKSAVVRNRIRRRVFEIIRRYHAERPLGIDLAITVFQPEAATMPARVLEQHLGELLTKANGSTTVRAIVNTDKEDK